MMADTPAPSGQPARGRGIRIAILLLLAGSLVAFFALGGQRYLSLDTIKAHRDELLLWSRDHQALAIATTFAVYAAAVACSLPGASLLSLLCGFLFGRWVGTLVIVGAATLGATLVFLAGRYLIADWARARMGALGRRIADGFGANAFNYLLFLRLVPAFPFFLVNLAPAFTGIRVSTYVGATAIGIVPGSFVFANLGETLGSIESLSGLVSGQTLLAFALLGTLALVPIALRWRRAGRPPTQ